MNRDAPCERGLGQDEPDTILVSRAQAGERHAFDLLVLRYQRLIYTLCVRMLDSVQEGEDACQESFLRAYRSLGSFTGAARFSTWLYQIALNTCRNQRQSWWRRLMRHSDRLDEPGDTTDSAAGRQVADPHASADEDLWRATVMRAVHKGLTRLNLRQRELIVLRDIQGLSYEEIREITGLQPGTVKSRLARAREALRHELKEVIE